MARSVWALLPEEMVELLINIQEPNAKAWLVAAIDAMPQAEATKVLVSLWAIWHARRKAVHEGIFQSPFATVCFIERFIADLDLIKAPAQQRRVSAGVVPRWIPPPSGVAKVNVDASLSKDERLAAVAAVARDVDGHFLGASVLTCKGISDPETMEAVACREGLALASDLNLQRIRLASDCANAVRTITEGSVLGSYGQLVGEIRAGMRSFQELEIVHEGRRSNTDAHNLARSSIYISLGRHVWLLNPPEGVPVNIIS
jgi:ribonuclease HI